MKLQRKIEPSVTDMEAGAPGPGHHPAKKQERCSIFFFFSFLLPINPAQTEKQTNHMDLKQLFHHLVLVSSIIQAIYKQGWMMSVTGDSMSHHLRESAHSRPMTLEDMTADCKQLTKIKALHRRHTDQLHHIWRHLLWFDKDMKAGSRNTKVQIFFFFFKDK